MRRLTFLAVIAALAAASCRPREKIRVEAPYPEAISSGFQMADVSAAPQLVRGFHNVEQGSWRWTAGRFSIALKPPPGSSTKGGRAVLKGSVPEALVGKQGAVTLSAMVNGGAIGSQTWSVPGEFTFVAPVPAAQLDAQAVTIDFVLDKFLPAGQADSRELGLIVSSVALEPAQ